MVYIRTLSRRRLPLGLRDAYGLNALDRLNIKSISMKINTLLGFFHRFQRLRNQNLSVKMIKRDILLLLNIEIIELLRIVVVDDVERPMPVRHDPMTFASMELYLHNSGKECSEVFRFQSFEHLRRFKDTFAFSCDSSKQKKIW